MGNWLTPLVILFLPRNLNPNDNSDQYKEIFEYLHSTKEKFLEQKAK